MPKRSSAEQMREAANNHLRISQDSLARMFGVSQRTAGRALHGRSRV